MSNKSLLQLYRMHIAEAQFSEAKQLLDLIEQRHEANGAMQQIVANERERLEWNGVLLAPSHINQDSLTTTRPTNTGIIRERLNHQHNWYFNSNLEAYLIKEWSAKTRPAMLCEVRSLLVLGNNFSLSTGVFRPISHYLNFLHHHGGPRLRSVQLDNNAEPDVIDALFNNHDAIIINGLQQICNVVHLAKSVQRYCKQGRIYGYLHETRWILDRLPDDQKQRVRSTIPYLDLLLCCQRQCADFAPYGTPKSHTILHNPTLPATSSRLSRRNSGQILMSGSVKERKGVGLFNACAERLTPEGFRFHWAGQIRDTATPLNAVVTHHGHLSSHDLQRVLRNTEIFFLSSIEDTFPLAAIEAYLHGCKVLLPRSTGLVDVLEGRSGVLIYDDHQVDTVVPLLQQLKDQPAPEAKDRQVISQRLGLEAFLDRCHRAIQPMPARQDSTETDQKCPSIAVIVHLYYTDLGFEFSRHLEAVAGPSTDLYITIPIHKDSTELRANLERMFSKRFRSLCLLSVPDRGMDISPFFEAIRHLSNQSWAPVDLILKIHTKKSLQVSGASKGQRWRRGLLDGLLGNRRNVKTILNRFERDSDLGLLAPEPFLMRKSQRDQVVAANDAAVNNLLSIYGLAPDPSRVFVRGTMFWTRATALLPNLLQTPLPTPEAFEPGHARDGSLAHAYERVLSYLPQRDYSLHAYQVQESAL